MIRKMRETTERVIEKALHERLVLFLIGDGMWGSWVDVIVRQYCCRSLCFL